jgi:hypothetical protein
VRSDSSGGWYLIARDGDTSATMDAVGAGSVSGPSIDIRERPRSFCVLCKRQRAESAGLRCIGHEPWSAPCAQVQTMSPADALLMDRRTAVPATTDTWTNSHATATGTSRRRIFATSVDQLSAGLKGTSSYVSPPATSCRGGAMGINDGWNPPTVRSVVRDGAHGQRATVRRRRDGAALTFIVWPGARQSQL